MVDIIVRHVDRSKGHNSVNEVLRVSGTRKVQGQKKQGDAGKKRVSSICLQNCVFKPLFHRGTPKIILLYPKEALPVNAFTGQTTKRQLIVHGEYSGITNCWTKISMIFQGLF